MLKGVAYDSNGRLTDDTGHSWTRVETWVEPGVAEAEIRQGCRFLVQPCLQPPTRGRAERFKSDVLPHLLTRQQAEALAVKSSVPTVYVAERWRSDREGNLLVFVEQSPETRREDELRNDW